MIDEKLINRLKPPPIAVVVDVHLAWCTFRTSGEPEAKLPAIPGRKGNAKKIRAYPKMGCLEEA